MLSHLADTKLLSYPEITGLGIQHRSHKHEFIKSLIVIPANAGIQVFEKLPYTGFRRYDANCFSGIAVALPFYHSSYELEPVPMFPLLLRSQLQEKFPSL